MLLALHGCASMTQQSATNVPFEVPANWSPTRTRPLCPFPQVARYSGSGDVEAADSWVCSQGSDSAE